MNELNGAIRELPKITASIPEQKPLGGKIGAEVISSGSGGGTVFVPYVSPKGIISWTNNGNLPNPEPVNIKGKDGANGIDGKDGYTPIKGVDYFTDSDKTELVSDVIAALPVYNGEVKRV